LVAVNPFAEFRVACETVLRDVLSRLFPEVSVSVRLDLPPSPEFGDLASSVCFEVAKQTGTKPLVAARKVVKALDVSGLPLVEDVRAAGSGYVNFYANLPEFSRLTIESVRALGKDYGCVKVDKPARIIVEHTSANPTHPIHIGTARNPVLGDALARILRARGHRVFRHYYVDDVGRQTAAIAYGYEKLGKPKPKGKPDHFIGVIYTITSCLIEVHRLKREIERARNHSTMEEISKLQRELDDWISVAVDLQSKHAQLFNKLAEEIGKDENPEFKVASLIRAYEAGEKNAKALIREISQLCIEGFKETLERAGITFDSWDWESDFVWNSDVKKVLAKLKATPYVFKVGQVLEFDADRVAEDLNLKQELGIREDYEIPSLTLLRADGTTLYTTRDIPYTLWKFRKAERVINVIGMEQPLAQLQLKLALCALGHVDYAKNLTHFAYNLVRLPGFRMESRKGRYITLDQVMDEAINRAYEEVSKRSPHLSEDERRKISNFVGIGALKYALVEVDPSKPVVFTWDRVLDFEKNSAPYIQYSHARAGSILRKAARKPERADYALLKEQIEHDIVLMLARFPEIFIEAADNLKPNLIADFANSLADKFNTFYNALPVLKAKPQELSDARLALVEATKIVLGNALNLLGIEAPERM
jgi:arginyl-tRNA synthetase